MKTGLTTEWLVLREMAETDLDALVQALTDDDVMRHDPFALDEAGVRAWIERNIRRYRILGFGLWAVCVKETDELAGDCGLTMQDINGSICPEIGYHIRKDRQRRGYAKEAAAAVRDWAFGNTPFRTLYASMKHTNEPSRSTAESIGMRFVEEYADEARGSTKVFAITKAQWLCLLGGWRFRKAEESEKDAVRALYASVTGSEFCAWNEAYPGDEEIDTDLANGNLYVLADGTEVIGAVSVISDNELEELAFWHEPGCAGEIARVTVSPSFQGNGAAGILVGEIEKVLSEAGRKAIHLLAAVRNVPACRLYHKAGFVLRSRCDMYGDTFYAFEKRLEK